MYAIFNIIFLPLFFKSAYKIGTTMSLAVVAALVWAAAVEFVVAWVPSLDFALGGPGAENLGYQLVVLLGGIVTFFLLTMLAGRIAANRFERVDL